MYLSLFRKASLFAACSRKLDPNHCLGGVKPEVQDSDRPQSNAPNLSHHLVQFVL